MSALTLDGRIGEGAYGHIYRCKGEGGRLFAVKIMEREGVPEQDVELQEEISAMERAADSDWAAELRYWQWSEVHFLLAMVSLSICSSME
jgi:hypothetical protein